MEEKKSKLENMDYVEKGKSKTNYHALAEDVANTTKNNFDEFVEFLGAYLEINIDKFGVVTVMDHLQNIELNVRMKRLESGKVKNESN